MEIDKRPFYIWLVVALANIPAVFAALGTNLFEASVTLLISLSITVVPILVSGLNSRLKSYFAYGVPILLTLPGIYFISRYFGCVGEYCGIALVYGLLLVLPPIIFIVFYVVGINARKRGAKFVLYVLGIEVILLVSLAYLSYGHLL